MGEELPSPKSTAQGLRGSCIPDPQRLCIGLVAPSLSQASAFETPAVSLFATAMHQHARLTVFTVRQPPDDRQPPPVERVIEQRDTRAAPRARDILRQTVSAIIAAHRRAPFDLLHGLWLYESGAAAVIAARILRIPVIVSVGGGEVVHLPQIAYGMRQSRRGRLIVRQVLRGATVVTGGSASILRLAEEAAGRHLRSARMPLPIDVSAFAAVRDQQRDPYALVQIAALLPVKRPELLLHTLREVRLHLPEAHLTILGEDPHAATPRLLCLASELGIAEALRIIGRVPHADLPDALVGHTLHVQTSLHESQGLGVLEAAAAGIPSVGTAVGTLADLAPDAAVALAVTQADPARLGASIVATLTDANALNHLRAHAIHRVEGSYDLRPIITQWLDLYTALTSRRD